MNIYGEVESEAVVSVVGKYLLLTWDSIFIGFVIVLDVLNFVCILVHNSRTSDKGQL